MKISNKVFGSILAWLLLSINPAAAAESYYVIFFSSQSADHDPKFSHSWATFVKASSVAGDNSKIKLDFFNISWLPASGVVKPVYSHPEPGKNHTLDETLDWLPKCNAHTLWEPIAICPELYDLALNQAMCLQANTVQYKALDILHRGHDAVNCMHAICDLVPNTHLITGTSHGDDATAKIVAFMTPFMLPTPGDTNWILSALGVNRLPFRHQTFCVTAQSH